MDKIQPGSGHLDSSAAHRILQSSTILDRRYVKRPATTNAGKYSSASRAHSDSVAPSRLINLGVHSTDLEVAQLRENIHAEVEAPTEDLGDATEEYLTEDAIALNLEVAETMDEATTAPVDEPIMTESPTMPEALHSNPDNFAEPTNSSTADNECTMSSSSEPVSMYTLEAMKHSMIQDLASNFSETPQSDKNICAPTEPTVSETAEYTTNDYTTTSPEPIDMISRATSDALASIRIATESAEVSDQMASLKAFANSIKSDNSPEMAELGNTIEKFANVALKSTKAKEEAENKVALSVNRSPRIAQSSTRLNRTNPTVHHVMSANSSSLNRPTLSRSPKVASINRLPSSTTTSTSKTRRPASSRATAVKKSPANRPTPDNRALEQALRSVATMDEKKPNAKSKKSHSKKIRKKGGFARFALALGCAGACIAAIIYFVGTNIPDISVQVAAMQTGIDASYPSYIPRDYSLGDISSENGRLTMRFNGPNGSSFTLVEEKSSWDSSALQRNYVEPTWGENFTTTHEQGITIFLSNSDAAWVNGGILYKITSSGNELTKKQLRNIVTSM